MVGRKSREDAGLTPRTTSRPLGSCETSGRNPAERRPTDTVIIKKRSPQKALLVKVNVVNNDKYKHHYK